MVIELFAHPFSSYCQKVLIALYENATPFTYRIVEPDHPDTGAEFAALWPPGRFPLLWDGERVIAESSTIIEYLQLAYPGAVPLIPARPK